MTLIDLDRLRPPTIWPSRDCKDVLHTSLRLDAVCERLPEPSRTAWRGRLLALNDDDGLGPFLLAHIVDPVLDNVVFTDHDGAPVKGTVAVVDSAVDLSVALRRLVDLLSLTADELTWSAVPLAPIDAERPRAAE